MKKGLIFLICVCVVVICCWGYRYYETKKFVDFELDYIKTNSEQAVPASSLGFVFILERIEETYLPLSFYVNPNELRKIIVKDSRNVAKSTYYEKSLIEFHRCMANEYSKPELKLSTFAFINTQEYCDNRQNSK